MADDENNLEHDDLQIDQAGDLADALSNGDESFITGEETRQPMSKGTLIIFGLVLAAGALVYFMYLKTGPSAADAATSEARAADETITEFLSAGNTNIKLMEDMLRNTERVVEQFRSYPSMKQVPLSDLQTNPFKFSSAESPTDDSMAQRKRDEERQAALKAVQGLALQSIMHSGAHKACMINNSMYQESDEVNGFTVERITAGSVVVRTGVFRFELKMQ